ncbi:MAG: hypothetical protein J6Y18_04900 [Candidatus Methanomethylophilaceae archaeon]|nr:hypothetical protein [Candidatus Methanomethylophilaceae archaeon]
MTAQHKVRIEFESNKGYPMRVMIDRSAAKVMKSGESYETVLDEGQHEVMLSVSIRKKPVMLDLKKDTILVVKAADVYNALTVDIS